MKRKSAGKLMNRVPGLRLLISSLPGSALRTHVESLGKHRDVKIALKALPGKLDIKRHSSSNFYLFRMVIILLYISIFKSFSKITSMSLCFLAYFTSYLLYLFDLGSVPHFCGDWSWNNFYSHVSPFCWIIQEGLCQL